MSLSSMLVAHWSFPFWSWTPLWCIRFIIDATVNFAIWRPAMVKRQEGPVKINTKKSNYISYHTKNWAQMIPTKKNRKRCRRKNLIWAHHSPDSYVFRFSPQFWQSEMAETVCFFALKSDEKACKSQIKHLISEVHCLRLFVNVKTGRCCATFRWIKSSRECERKALRKSHSCAFKLIS